MGRVPGIEIVRRAYKIWEDSGKPEGKDQEFYHRAERELEEEQAQRKAGQSAIGRWLNLPGPLLKCSTSLSSGAAIPCPPPRQSELRPVRLTPA
jgi:Protein of unknown function (DUF2934)